MVKSTYVALKWLFSNWPKERLLKEIQDMEEAMSNDSGGRVTSKGFIIKNDSGANQKYAILKELLENKE